MDVPTFIITINRELLGEFPKNSDNVFEHSTYIRDE